MFLLNYWFIDCYAYKLKFTIQNVPIKFNHINSENYFDNLFTIQNVPIKS